MNDVFVSVGFIEFSDAIKLQDIFKRNDSGFGGLEFYRLDGSYVSQDLELDDNVIVSGSVYYDEGLEGDNLPAILIVNEIVDVVMDPDKCKRW